MSCFYCGDKSSGSCPTCGKEICELCLELPCENTHKEPEPEGWDYLRASPEEQARELEREFFP